MAPTHSGSSAPPQIPGHPVHPEVAENLRHQVANILQRDTTRFPGAQPVSFAREHILELQHAEYFMCEKTDGIRCLLYLNWREGPEPWTLLIDRKNNYYEVTPPLTLPHHSSPYDPDRFLYGTILDGELVNDAYPEGRRLIFYVFDCLAIDGANMTTRTLDKRLGYLQKQLFEPWKMQQTKFQQPPQSIPFLVKEKQAQSAYHISHMLDQVLPNLRHGNDGLIFTCKNTKYKFGTDDHILKWKPPHENTIDFKLRLGDFPPLETDDGGDEEPDYDAMPTRFQLLINHGKNSYKAFDHDLAVTPAEWDMLKSLNERLDGRIIECYRDTNGSWRFKKDDDGTPRWRDDKTEANHVTTVNSVMESIQDPVTEADLRNAEANIKEAVQKLRAADARKTEDERQREASHVHKKRKLEDGAGGGAS
jgi:mRNA guanylyltransferase